MRGRTEQIIIIGGTLMNELIPVNGVIVNKIKLLFLTLCLSG